MKKFTIIALLALSLTACGVKPGSVAPPQGEDADTFPQNYPAPTTLPR